MLTMRRGFGWAQDIHISNAEPTDQIFVTFRRTYAHKATTFGPFAVVDGVVQLRLTGAQTHQLQTGVNSWELALQRGSAVFVVPIDIDVDVTTVATASEPFGPDLPPLVRDEGDPIILAAHSDSINLTVSIGPHQSGGGSGGVSVPQIDLATRVSVSPGVEINSLVDEITLSSTASPGLVIGTLSVRGPTNGVSHTFSLLDDAGGLFSLSGPSLELAAAVPQQANTLQVTVSATPSSGSPLARSIPVTINETTVPVTLNALALSASSVAQDAVSGTLVGSLLNRTAGATLALIDDEGGRFQLSGGQILAGTTALNAGTASITVRESLAGATNSPRDSVLTIAVNAVSDALAYQEGQGQSLMVGFNSVDDLDSQWHAILDDVFAFDNTNNALNRNALVEAVPYALVPTGQTLGGITGLKGEYNVGGDGAGVGFTFGTVAEFHENGLWTEASALYQLKAASAGKHIEEFIPERTAEVFNALTYGRRAVRNWLASETRPVHMQAKFWAQGEANTNAGRAADNTAHPDITGYRAELQRVLDFDIAQFGFAPPWFINKLKLRNGDSGGPYAGVTDPFTLAMNAELEAFCRYTVNIDGDLNFTSITDNGAGNGRNDNCFFLDQAAQANQNADPHITAVSTEKIGRAAAAALRSIHGGTGWSTAYQITQIKPVIITAAETLSNTTIGVATTVSDDGTLYAVAVPAGSAAPTAAQIIAGSGGAIVSTDTATLNGNPQSFAGAPLSVTVTGLSAGTAYDVHMVLVERDQGTQSDITRLTGLVTTGIVTNVAPSFSTLPSISGTAAQDQTLMLTYTAAGTPPPAAALQWRRDGGAISGATANTYALTAADVGSAITCAVTLTNSAGSVSETAPGVGPVQAATGGGAVASAWDATFLTTEFDYSNSDRTVARSAGATGTDHARGQTPITSGKRYFELHHEAGSGGNRVRAGLITTTFGNGGGVQDGAQYVGIDGNTVQYTGGTVGSAGVSLPDGYRVGVAVDADNELFWIINYSRGSDWNGTPGADPATGVGGLSYSGLPTGTVVPGVSMFTTGVTNHLRVLPSEWGDAADGSRSAPAGFTALP